MVRHGSEGRGAQVTDDLVEAGDLLLQKVVLLLGHFLPLLRHLQGLEELGILHVQVLNHHVRLGALVQLEVEDEAETEAGLSSLQQGLQIYPHFSQPT